MSSNILRLTLTKRLFEICKTFDSIPSYKYYVVRPSQINNNVENFAYNKLFGKDRIRLLPITYDETNKPIITPISFTKTLKEVIYSVKNNEIGKQNDYEIAMWNILKYLIKTSSIIDNSSGSNGFLSDPDNKTIKYASTPIKEFYKKTQDILKKKEEIQVASQLENGISLISHPLRKEEKYRYSIIYLYSYNNEMNKDARPVSCGINLNTYKCLENTLTREGGDSQNNLNIDLYDYKEDESVKPQYKSDDGIAINFAHKPGYTSESFHGITNFFNITENIKKGLWIPINLPKHLILNHFNYSQLSSMECGLLKRMYWEEIILLLGKNFEGLSTLSSNYTKSQFFQKKQIQV